MKKFITLMLSCLLMFAVGTHVSFSKTVEKQKFETNVKLEKAEAATEFNNIEVSVRCISIAGFDASDVNGFDALHSNYTTLEKPKFTNLLTRSTKHISCNRQVNLNSKSLSTYRISYYNRV